MIGLLLIQCIAVVGWGLLRRERMIQYPFLAAVVFLGWVMPQLFGLSNEPNLPNGALEKTVLMSMLCLAAIYVGYNTNSRPVKLFDWQYRYNRLLIASVLFSVVGIYFHYQTSRLAPEGGSQWTGEITIYYFFSGLLTLGFVIAILLYIRRKSWVTFAIVGLNCIIYLDRILIAGRRAAMIEFGMIILLAIWFKTRWVPARSFVVSALLVGALLVNSMPEYRSSTSLEGITSTDWNQVLSIDYAGNLKRLAEEGGHELRNATYGIAAADRTLQFDYGASLWNTLVFRFVPAQFVGIDVKSSLMFDLGNLPGEVFGYFPMIGTTATGMQTAFLSFWFFGAFIFALIGWIMSRWYLAALRGNLAAQMLAMLTPSYALHAITHQYENFFVPFVQWAIFLLPVLLIARHQETGRNS